MPDISTFYGLKVVAYGGAAALTFMDRETGELYRVRLADGFHDLSAYQPLLAAYSCEIDSALVNDASSGVRRVTDQRSDAFGQTAASPTYTPTEAVRFQRAVEDVARRVAADIAAKEVKRHQRALEPSPAPRPVSVPPEAAVMPSEEPPAVLQGGAEAAE